MKTSPSKMIKAKHYKGNEISILYNDSVDQCPHCQNPFHGAPTSANYSLLSTSSQRVKDALYLTYQCKIDDCQKTFLVSCEFIPKGYHRSEYYLPSDIYPKRPQVKDWPTEVTEISPLFSQIYNQALNIELYGFNHGAGPTYRKSLEFLIKDYVISLNPDKEEEIRKKFLGTIIREDIDAKNVEECAKRATWLGNDETHYTRKWEKKDIGDLKTLIQLTVNHIHNEILTEKYKKDMP